MDKAKVAQIVGEELRTNVGLRRQLGMVEGDSTGVILDDEASLIHFTNSEGETFLLAVGDESDLDVA